jgi:hypothetical protein
MCRIIQLNQLRAGDILLFIFDEEPEPKGLWNKFKWRCFSKITRDIRRQTDSEYTHAAICYDSTNLVHAAKLWSPVEMIDVRDLVSSCKYAAVFRSSCAFRGTQFEKLRRFLERIVRERAGYDFWGAFRYTARKEEDLRTLRERLEAHFNGEQVPSLADKKSFFCSELVGACLCVTGAIEPRAAVVFNPSTTSPAELGRDPTWGTFLGYLVPNATTEIPENDEFYHNELLPANMGGI